MNLDEFRKLITEMTELGTFSNIQEHVMLCAKQIITELRNQNLDEDEFLSSLVSTVAAETARQTVIVMFMILFRPKDSPTDPREFLKRVK